MGNYGTALSFGGFRIRHALFRLAGEGLGGSWNLKFGQTWNIFGQVPQYLGSSVSFGGARILAGRSPQLSFQHSLKFLHDFTWENTIGAMSASSQFQEVPRGEISTRLIYAGWQGFQGGARRPLNLGFLAIV